MGIHHLKLLYRLIPHGARWARMTPCSMSFASSANSDTSSLPSGRSSYSATTSRAPSASTSTPY